VRGGFGVVAFEDFKPHEVPNVESPGEIELYDGADFVVVTIDSYLPEQVSLTSPPTFFFPPPTFFSPANFSFISDLGYKFRRLRRESNC
jgi:hypothetical protein